MDISRRGFVKATAVALASAAAAGTMSSLVGCASGEGQSTTAASGDGQKYTSVCRFCGCGCGVICEVKDNKLISVTATRTTSPTRVSTASKATTWRRSCTATTA